MWAPPALVRLGHPEFVLYLLALFPRNYEPGKNKLKRGSKLPPLTSRDAADLAREIFEYCLENLAKYGLEGISQARLREGLGVAYNKFYEKLLMHGEGDRQNLISYLGRGDAPRERENAVQFITNGEIDCRATVGYRLYWFKQDQRDEEAKGRRTRKSSTSKDSKERPRVKWHRFDQKPYQFLQLPPNMEGDDLAADIINSLRSFNEECWKDDEKGREKRFAISYFLENGEEFGVKKTAAGKVGKTPQWFTNVYKKFLANWKKANPELAQHYMNLD